MFNQPSSWFRSTDALVRVLLAILRSASIMAILCAPLCVDSAIAVDSIWNFDAPNPFAPSVGSGSISYYDPNNTGWGPTLTQFGTASGFSLAPFPDGGSGSVMKFPATTPTQGYKVTPGGGSLVQNYTMIWDYYLPPASDGDWQNLYQTSLTNSNDGEFFINNSPSGGIGISGNYTGSVVPNTWNRIAVTHDAAGTMNKYINGTLVGTQSAAGSRWELGSYFYIFTDENNETAPAYTSSFRYVDSVLSGEQVRLLGDVNSAGAGVPGIHVPEPPPPPPLPSLPPGGRTMIVGHRGASSVAPENTLASLHAALAVGSDVIESDIHLTSDGVAVVFHDDTLDRTTNGTGPIANLTLAQVKALDAGSWFGPQFAGEKIPTLAEHLTAAKGKAIVYLDVKVSPNQAFRNAVFAAMNQAGVGLDAIWTWPGNSAYSNDPRIGNAPIQLLNYVPGDLSDANLQALKATGILGVGVTLGAVTQEAVNAFNRNGMIFDVYTINDPAVLEQLIAMGVGAIETDVPDIMRQYIISVPGDVNLDDTVNIFDINFISSNWGGSGPAGDANHDGIINIFDVNLVSAHWGLGFKNPLALPGAGAAAAGASVPEPATGGLLVLGVALWFCGQRFAKRSCPGRHEP